MDSADPEQQGVAPVRPCEACGAAMDPGQDWCLECGTAAPGRLGAKPGMRAAATVVSLTLALVGGAVAASYAALSSDAQQEAGRPAPPSGTPVAQAPPGTIPSPAPSDALPPGTVPTTPTIPTPGDMTSPPSASTTPETPSPPSIPSFTPPTPSTPTITIPDARETPSSRGDSGDSDGNSGSGGNRGSGGTTGSGGDSGSGGRGDDDSDGGTTTTTPSRNEPQPISIPAGAAKLYDPSGRVTAKGDPAKAVDGDSKSSWFVTTSNPDKDMAAGLVIDLGKPHGLRVLELATSTPGFRAEIYAADSREMPPDILDTRWAHIVDRSNVDETDGKDKNTKGDGRERIVLGGGSAKYRYVLIWFTTPPDGGPTVRIADVDLLG